MNRKEFLKFLGVISAFPYGLAQLITASSKEILKSIHRVRPGDPGWPSKESWDNLKQKVRGRLIKLSSPFEDCHDNKGELSCDELFKKKLKNPYYIRNNPALTQATGWLNAWKTEPSIYAVEVQETNDVVAAVNFARQHNLRLVVKGGAHSYQGRSNAPDSLLIWMRPMDDIKIHDGFIPQGAAGKEVPKQAVTIGAGAIWMQAYDKVTTQRGRYVQGGGCLTVGVAGLIQSGGFGSFSKKYGLAAGNLLEAEVVTADGKVLIANAYQNSDLFWALKGGGGSSFGVITKCSLKTHDLPEVFGGVSTSIRAKSDDAFHKLISYFIRFYHQKLLNPNWGEQIILKSGNIFEVSMLFHGLNEKQASEVWEPFKKWVVDRLDDFEFETSFQIWSLPAKHFWDINFFNKRSPESIIANNQPGAPYNSFIWAGNQEEAGEFWDGYHSVWLPASLLQQDQQDDLSEALFAASRYWETSLHFNKGLAGASPSAKKEADNTAMNPIVSEAFALAIIAGNKPPAYPGIPGHEPNIIDGRIDENIMQQAMDELLNVVPKHGSYVSESDYFQENWQQSFWGSNYARLTEIKKKYDPNGLFYIHHGVGSEEWSDNGFTRVKNDNILIK